MPEPDAVYVCGPPALVEAVRGTAATTSVRELRPADLHRSAESSGGRDRFTDTGVEVTDDGRPLLEQAEAANLNPRADAGWASATAAPAARPAARCAT